MKNYKLDIALREAKAMFPEYADDKISKACVHFVNYMNGDSGKDFLLLRDPEIKRIFDRLILGARMDY